MKIEHNLISIMYVERKEEFLVISGDYRDYVPPYKLVETLIELQKELDKDKK